MSSQIKQGLERDVVGVGNLEASYAVQTSLHGGIIGHQELAMQVEHEGVQGGLSDHSREALVCIAGLHVYDMHDG